MPEKNDGTLSFSIQPSTFINSIMEKLLFFILPFMALGLFAGEYPDISVKELQSAIKKGKVAVIDVNGAKSFARGHIPTAIDFSSNGKALAKLFQG